MAKLNVRALREATGLNGTDFWMPVGVTQSGGSRYENGNRRMPKPVLELVRLLYIEKVDLSKVRRADVELVEYLKTNKPLMRQLRKESDAYHKGR